MKKFMSIVASAVIALTGMFSTPAIPQAQAWEGSTVLLGDSVFANPAYSQVKGNGVTSSNQLSSLRHTAYSKPGKPSPHGCTQGAHTVSTRLAYVYGHKTVNYACSGASGIEQTGKRHLNSQVNHAISSGALNRGTRNVMIMVGLNDFFITINRADKRTRFISAMTKNVNRVKAAAPNARITFVSYPAFSASNGALCPVRTGTINPNSLGVNLVPFFFKTVEDQANNAMWTVSQKTGTRFYNLSADSLSHNMCAPNSRRWIAGVVEYSEPHNLSNHLTHAGVNGVADLLHRKVLS